MFLHVKLTHQRGKRKAKTSESSKTNSTGSSPCYLHFSLIPLTVVLLVLQINESSTLGFTLSNEIHDQIRFQGQANQALLN